MYRLVLFIIISVLPILSFAQSEIDTLYNYEQDFNLVIFESNNDTVAVVKQQQVLFEKKNRTIILPRLLGTEYTYKLQVSAERNVTTWQPNDCFEITPLNYSLEINNSQNYFYLWDFEAEEGEGSYIQWQYNDSLRVIQSYWYKSQGKDTYSYVHTFTNDSGKPYINIRLFLYIYLNDGTSDWHCLDIYAPGKLD